MWLNRGFVQISKEILNEKLRFLCSDMLQSFWIIWEAAKLILFLPDLSIIDKFFGFVLFIKFLQGSTTASYLSSPTHA